MNNNKTFYITYWASKHKKHITRQGKHFWIGFFVALTFTLKWFFMFPQVEGRDDL
jgi:hypothetical protein